MFSLASIFLGLLFQLREVEGPSGIGNGTWMHPQLLQSSAQLLIAQAVGGSHSAYIVVSVRPLADSHTHSALGI